MKSARIRVIVICLFIHKNSILVFHGYDTVKGTSYYRPLGGEIEFGETAEVALKREIHEELQQEISDVRLLSVLESLFEWNGKPGHEIVFVYNARFADSKVYRKKELMVHEENQTLKASWRSPDSFNEYHRLVPEGLNLLVNDYL